MENEYKPQNSIKVPLSVDFEERQIEEATKKITDTMNDSIKKVDLTKSLFNKKTLSNFDKLFEKPLLEIDKKISKSKLKSYLYKTELPLRRLSDKYGFNAKNRETLFNILGYGLNENQIEKQIKNLIKTDNTLTPYTALKKLNTNLYNEKIIKDIQKANTEQELDDISVNNTLNKVLTNNIKIRRSQLKEYQKQEKERLKEEEKLRKEQIKQDEEELKRKRGFEFLELIGRNLSDYDKKKIQKKIKSKELSYLEDEFSKTPKTIEDYDILAKKIVKVSDEINKLNKELEKGRKIGFFEKIFNTFKRVGFYRIARRFFSFVEQGFGDSLRSLTLFDNDFNKTMSSITSSFQILSSSIMISVKPALEIIQPIISFVSKGIASMAEAISYLIAKLKGSSEYLKINTEYMKDFNQQSNLFSFDKFESLQSNEVINSSDMFEWGKTSDGFLGLNKEAENLLTILTTMAGVSIIKWIISGDAIKDTALLGEKIGIIAGYTALFASVFKLLQTIIDLFKNWDSKSIEDKVYGIAYAFLYLISTISIIRGLIYHDWLKVGAGIAGLTTGLVVENVRQYANGGLPKKGDLFIANEKGPELVTIFSSGQSGVTNIAQFEEAMVRALYRCSDLFERGEITVVAPIDGADVARSRRFIDEFNRRNSGISIK